MRKIELSIMVLVVAFTTCIASAEPVLIDWGNANDISGTADSNGNYWNTLGAGAGPLDVTYSNLVDAANAATEIDVNVVLSGGNVGFGGAAINGPVGEYPFDTTGTNRPTVDGIYSQYDTAVATITFSQLAPNTAYDFSAIGGRDGQSSKEGVISVVTGSGTAGTLLGDGTVLNFRVISDSAGTIAIAYAAPSSDYNQHTFNALSIEVGAPRIFDGVLIDWGDANDTSDSNGNYWNTLGAGAGPLDVTYSNLVDAANAATEIDVNVVLSGSGVGFGGTAINGPVGEYPFDTTGTDRPTVDGIYSQYDTDVATITFSQLAPNTAYDFSAIGGRDGQSSKEGVISVVTGSGTAGTLLGDGTVLNFRVISDSAGTIAIAYAAPSSDYNQHTFNALGIKESEGVLIDWSDANDISGSADDNGNYWNTLGAGLNPLDVTYSNLVDAANAATEIDVRVVLEQIGADLGGASAVGFGGTAINGPVGEYPFDITGADRPTVDGIYAAYSNTIATITFSQLAPNETYDFSAIGGRDGQSSQEGVISVVTGSGTAGTLLGDGTVLDFRVISDSAGTIAIAYAAPSSVNNPHTFNALRMRRRFVPKGTIILMR